MWALAPSRVSLQQNAKAINDKVRLYAEVGKALIAAYKARTDLGKALESVLGWDQFATTVEEAERLVEPFDCDFLDEMCDRSPQIRQYSPKLRAVLLTELGFDRFVVAFEFDAAG